MYQGADAASVLAPSSPTALNAATPGAAVAAPTAVSSPSIAPSPPAAMNRGAPACVTKPACVGCSPPRAVALGALLMGRAGPGWSRSSSRVSCGASASIAGWAVVTCVHEGIAGDENEPKKSWNARPMQLIQAKDTGRTGTNTSAEAD